MKRSMRDCPPKILDHALSFQRSFGFNSTKYSQNFKQLTKEKRIGKHFIYQVLSISWSVSNTSLVSAYMCKSG